MEDRDRLEGWRVRETARMMSTIDDSSAVSEVLSPTIPKSVVTFMIEKGYLRRLAFLGEGANLSVSYITGYFRPDNYQVPSK